MSRPATAFSTLDYSSDDMVAVWWHQAKISLMGPISLVIPLTVRYKQVNY